MTAASPLETPLPPKGARDTRSLSDALAGHRNSLGVIRLVLASAVIFSHAFPLGGWSTDDPMKTLTKGQESIGGFAVLGFFAISGYLIAKSGMKAFAATDVDSMLR